MSSSALILNYLDKFII